MEEIKNAVLRELSLLKESEDHIEFKEAKHNFNWDGGAHKDPKERRHCILGYVAALANEKGGKLVFGMKDHWPHEVVGSTFEQGNLGALEDAILLRSKIGKISMSKEYQRIYSEIHSTKSVNWISALKACAARYDGIITRKTYMEFLPDWVSVDKVRYSLSKLESLKVLKREGTGKGTKYYIVSIPENIDL